MEAVILKAIFILKEPVHAMMKQIFDWDHTFWKNNDTISLNDNKRWKLYHQCDSSIKMKSPGIKKQHNHFLMPTHQQDTTLALI